MQMTDIEIRLEAERLYQGMEQAADECGLGSIKQRELVEWPRQTQGKFVPFDSEPAK